MFEIKVLVEDMRKFLQSQNKKGESIQNLEAIKEKKVTNAVTKKKKNAPWKKKDTITHLKDKWIGKNICNIYDKG